MEVAVSMLRYVSCIVMAVAVAGCASKPVYRDETFAAETPFSKKVKGSGEVVCWSVKRAFLTQGYMLERSSDPVIVTPATSPACVQVLLAVTIESST